jgi:hypothetical protein
VLEKTLTAQNMMFSQESKTADGRHQNITDRKASAAGVVGGSATLQI